MSLSSLSWASRTGPAGQGYIDKCTKNFKFKFSRLKKKRGVGGSEKWYILAYEFAGLSTNSILVQHLATGGPKNLNFTTEYLGIKINHEFAGLSPNWERPKLDCQELSPFLLVGVGVSAINLSVRKWPKIIENLGRAPPSFQKRAFLQAQIGFDAYRSEARHLIQLCTISVVNH